MTIPAESPRQNPLSSAEPAIQGENIFRAAADEIGVDFHRFQRLKQTDPHEAGLCFARFKAALLARMTWEDETLLPALDRKLGARAGNISARFRSEHDQIRNLLTSIDAKLAQPISATESEEAALESVLSAHNHWEHEVVYPVFA